jgi:flagellar hook-basal body complex protein FliE
MELKLAQSFNNAGKLADDQPTSFPDLLKSGVMQVNSVQQDARSQVHELLTGGDVNQVEVFTAVQKADMAFRMLVQVRNKLMAAYEELNAIRI